MTPFIEKVVKCLLMVIFGIVQYSIGFYFGEKVGIRKGAISILREIAEDMCGTERDD